MKPTRMVAKIAGAVLAGIAVLSLASCGSVEGKYLKDLEARVSKLEAKVGTADVSAYEALLSEISELREQEKYEELPADEDFPEEKKERLAALKERINEANKKAPENGEDEFSFKAEKNTDGSYFIVITGYNGERKSLVIPATIQNLPVREIGKNAFKLKEIVSVVIPKGVRKIRDGAFYNKGISRNPLKCIPRDCLRVLSR